MMQEASYFVSGYLKSDLNEVIFVLELWQLLCKNIRIKTICIFEKNSTHKKYSYNNDLPLFYLFYPNESGYNSFFCEVLVTSYTIA